MEDTKNGDKQSRILQGIYVNLVAKMDELRQAVSKELQFGSVQQAEAYAALEAEIKEGMEHIVNELQYLAQQNSAINDLASEERSDVKSAVADTRAALADMHEAYEGGQARLQDTMKDMEERLLAAIDSRIHDSLQALMPPPVEIDYDLLAEKVAARLAPVAEEVKAEPPVPEEETAETEVPAEEGSEEASAEPAAEPSEATEPTLSETEENFAYDILAEKIASILPETDYDVLVDKVLAALPKTDSDEIAERVVAALQEGDSSELVSRITEAIPLVDYSLVAEKVSALLDETSLKLSDEAVEAIALRVAELLRGDALDLERLVSEAEPEEAPAVEAPAPEPQPEPQPEPEPVPESVPEPAPTPVPAPTPTPVVVEDENKMLRYKRSFVAKLIGSEEDIKEYYSDLKNIILSYGKVRSQINWTNDRFFIGNDSIIKIGMRGKTLVVYLALDPSEFPETVYHQKFAGDTKMYEMTPMMVKVKSAVAVKKVTRLIDLLMERNGVVKEPRERVDYAAQYFFRTDEELLAEGLIKTAVVDKSDMDF